MNTFAPNGEVDARWGWFLLFWDESSERMEMMGMMGRMEMMKRMQRMEKIEVMQMMERMGRMRRMELMERIKRMEMTAPGNAPWMLVEKLPLMYGNRQIRWNVEKPEKIFFRGKVPVFFYRTTALILWEMDRELTGLPPLDPGVIEILLFPPLLSPLSTLINV
ncbi:unnamed protein product [Darwinula stevensoni]|uniref:Uncharacterized protein n=1 Tax=Darwinula stevensoni TaxID=69355 RepID=A0A7R9AEC8_9CRUS|nr:unnamed protein product [Darwinula stevensoni]CAG0901457.1 unnamed protein product [Darwinula stevensoni]